MWLNRDRLLGSLLVMALVDSIAWIATFPPTFADRNSDRRPARQSSNDDAWFTELLKYGTPEGTVLRRGKFVLAFDGRTRCPWWVLERLTRETLAGSAIRRKEFSADHSIPKEFRPTAADYAEHIYDQGHMAPADDFGDQSDSDATFTFSNAVPQIPELNQLVWRSLEMRIRTIVREPDVDTVWVLTCPIFWEPDSDKHSMWIEFIGPHHVHVPQFCGKTILVLRGKAAELRAWIVPNRPDVKKDIDDLDKFAVPVDQLEEWAGIDCWPWLDRELQDKLEAAK